MRTKLTALKAAAWNVRKPIAKEFGLLAIMMLITATIVTIETGHIESGLLVASIAGPIKAIAASLYHRFV